MKKKSCGIVLVQYDNEEPRYLIVQHHAGHWGIPKGGQEAGESDKDTARREVLEEVGIEEYVFDEHYQYVQQYTFERDGNPIEKEVVFFLARVASGKVRPQEEEIATFQWLPYTKLQDFITHTETLVLMKHVHEYLT